jgi:hypothetical protein
MADRERRTPCPIDVYTLRYTPNNNDAHDCNTSDSTCSNEVEKKHNHHTTTSTSTSTNSDHDDHDNDNDDRDDSDSADHDDDDNSDNNDNDDVDLIGEGVVRLLPHAYHHSQNGAVVVGRDIGGMYHH